MVYNIYSVSLKYTSVEVCAPNRTEWLLFSLQNWTCGSYRMESKCIVLRHYNKKKNPFNKSDESLDSITNKRKYDIWTKWEWLKNDPFQGLLVWPKTAVCLVILDRPWGPRNSFWMQQHDSTAALPHPLPLHPASPCIRFKSRIFARKAGSAGQSSSMIADWLPGQ